MKTRFRNIIISLGGGEFQKIGLLKLLSILFLTTLVLLFNLNQALAKPPVKPSKPGNGPSNNVPMLIPGLPQPPVAKPNTAPVCVGSTILDVVAMTNTCQFDAGVVCKNLDELAQQYWDCYVKNPKPKICHKVKLKTGEELPSNDAQLHSALEPLIQLIYVNYLEKYCEKNNTSGAITDSLDATIANLIVGQPIGLACQGRRTFPDDSTEPTAHAFSICKAKDGGLYVHDPNDPAMGWISCTFGEDGLKWTCEYFDSVNGQTTQQTTTQCYTTGVPLDAHLIKLQDACKEIGTNGSVTRPIGAH